MPSRMSRRTLIRHAVLFGELLVGGAATVAAAAPAPGGRWFSSLVWAVLENHGFRQVVSLPSHQRLQREGAALTRYFAVSHPSGPNYRAMASGEIWGHDEETDAFHPSIASEAAPRGIPSYIYHIKGVIARRHNPLRDLHAPVAAEKRGLAALAQDLAGGLPVRCLVYCGWDDDNNAHDGPLETADRNVGELLDVLAKSRWFNTPDALQRYPAFFLCWDEDDGNENNHVFAAWWGRGVKAGLASATRHTHYGFCRTMTENWQLAALGRTESEPPIVDPFAE